MSRLTKRIKQNLTEVGARATPSPDAWLQIQERIEREGDNHEMEVVMIETDERRTSRGRRPLALAAAAAVLLMGVAATVLVVADGSDERVQVAGPSDTAPVDAPVAITVDGRSYVLNEPELCYQGEPADDTPLLHVIGKTDDGFRVELSFHHDPDPLDPTDAAGYTGRLSVHEGATARSWRPDVTTEPWPYLSIGEAGVTGEVAMTDRTGEAVDVTLAIRCDS